MGYSYNPFTKEINITGTSVSGTAIGNVTVFNEVPTPAPDGMQTVFTLANTYTPNSLVVVLDGLQQIKTTDYSEATNGTFTMVTAPASDETLWAHYIKV